MGRRCAGCRLLTADSESVDETTRPGRGEIIRLRLATFQQLRTFFGEIIIDLMAVSEIAQLGAATGTGEQHSYRSVHCTIASGQRGLTPPA